MTRIKICGITTPADARLAVAAGADALGVVFAPSPRRVTPIQAQRIIDAVPPFVTVVGIFVNAPIKEVRHVLKACRLQALQFHGEETNLYCATFRAYCKIIKAFRIRDRGSLTHVAAYSDIDAVLLDSYHPERHGGTGIRLLPALVAGIPCNRPLIIAGGVTPQNAGEIIRLLRPYGLDVSSGVECRPGKKDPRRMTALFEAVRRASANHDH